MKKIYSVLVAGLLAGSAVAQQVPMKGQKLPAGEFRSVHSSRAAVAHKANAQVSGYIDYGWNDADDAGFVWNFNSTFVGADTNMNYVGVALYPFKGIIDYSDNQVDFDWQYFPTLTYKIDTVFVVFTHENNSGQYDKLNLQIVALDANNALTANATVLGTWKDSTNTSLSPSGNWLGQNARFVQVYLPGYTTTPGQKVGCVFRYIAPKQDTLGMQGTFVDDNIPGNSGTTNQAQFATSFMAYPPFIPTPTPNRNITTGGAGNYIENQNWNLSVAFTANDITGINDAEKSATLYQNLPNPVVGGTSVIKYETAQAMEVTFEFTDISGRVVKVINEGNQPAGKHRLVFNMDEFRNGVYFYTMKTSNGTSLTKKMIVE